MLFDNLKDMQNKLSIIRIEKKSIYLNVHYGDIAIILKE